MSETSDKGESGVDEKAGESTESESSGSEGGDSEAEGAPSSKDDAAEDAAEKSETDDDVAHPAAPAAAPEGPRPSYAFLAVVTVVTLAADLGSKLWAEKNFRPNMGEQLVVWKDVMAFTHDRNPGGAWGMLRHLSAGQRITFFVVVSVVAVGFILSLYRKTHKDQTALTWGLPLVLGGALGNLVDRIRYGEVVDFIKVHLGSYQYPTFNVADIAICVGVGLMAIDMFTPRRRRRLGSAKPPAESVKVAG